MAMKDPVRIASANGRRALIFRDVEGDYFTVALDAGDCNAELGVYAFADAHGLADLFVSMAEEWRGWEGEKSWCSLEGEFELHATTDALGYVAIRAVLTNANLESEEPWHMDAVLVTEAGQLERMAVEVCALFEAEKK